MSSTVIGDTQMADSQDTSIQVLPSNYGCEILLEKTTLEKAKDKSFPTDAYLIWYIDDGN